MSNQHTTYNQSVYEGASPHNVITVSFEDDQNAYNALTRLQELDSQGRVGVQEAVVAVRDEDGQVVEKDRIESPSMVGTASGGLIGLLIGIIGGPLGMLVGGTSGLLFGSLFDIADADDTDTGLGVISGAVTTRHSSVLAVVSEPTPDIIDAAMAALGGTVQRRPVAEIEAELAAAEDAERKAKHEARKELMQARQEHNKEVVHAKVEALKAKLPQGQKTPA